MCFIRHLLYLELLAYDLSPLVYFWGQIDPKLLHLIPELYTRYLRVAR